MGFSHLSDALTGLSFTQGEPVVFIVIARARGGYPDPEKAAAIAPVYPSDAFAPVSMPIRGAAGCYGDVHPDFNGPAWWMAASLYGYANWDAFAADAFDFSKGVRRMPSDRAAQVFARASGLNPDKDAEREILGVMAVSEATWEFMQTLYPGGGREEEIDAVEKAIRDAREAGENIWTSRLLGLRDHSFRLPGEGRKHSLLARALVEGDGVGRLDHRLAAQAGDLLDGISSGCKDHGFTVRDLLGGLRDGLAFQHALARLNRVIGPSPNGGQSDDPAAMAGLAACAAAQAMERFERIALEGDPDSPVFERAAAFSDAVAKLDHEGFAATMDRIRRAAGPSFP